MKEVKSEAELLQPQLRECIEAMSWCEPNSPERIELAKIMEEIITVSEGDHKETRASRRAYWLWKRGALRDFCTLVDSRDCLLDFFYFNDRARSGFLGIDEAFYWRQAPQGVEYWSRLSLEFNEYFNNLDT